MKLFVYMDESGVFDRSHEDWFVYGGVIFRDLDSDARARAVAKYSAVENAVRRTH